LVKEALKNPHLYSEAEMTYMRKAKKELKNQLKAQKLSELKNSK
jgi:hypothetical protein|tara:strand:+ start:820 stop:951 length:132 start_codon:yes stop_codon:yes gene_type:complete